MRRLALLLLLVVGACSGDDDPPGATPDGGSPGVDADPTPGDWITLIEGEWSLPAGTPDYYLCVRKTLDRDYYINEFEAIAPDGTHHTVLTIGEPSGPDGVYPCNAGTNANAMIYGSGVGTNPLKLPDGVAVKASKGQQLLLNLHLYNASDAELNGISGTRVKVIDPGGRCPVSCVNPDRS